jgi:hypothetical protein
MIKHICGDGKLHLESNPSLKIPQLECPMEGVSDLPHVESQ